MDDSIHLVSPGMGSIGRNLSRQQVSQNQKTEKHPRGNPADPQLRNACVEMESLFINYLLQEMRATVDKSGFLGGGRAEEIFTSLLDEKLSKEISASGGIGISSMLLEQLGKGRVTRSED